MPEYPFILSGDKIKKRHEKNGELAYLSGRADDAGDAKVKVHQVAEVAEGFMAVERRIASPPE